MYILLERIATFILLQIINDITINRIYSEKIIGLQKQQPITLMLSGCWNSNVEDLS